MKHHFLLGLLMLSGFAAHANSSYLECSEFLEGDPYFEVKADNGIVTEIVTARYLERQGPINPVREFAEPVYTKGIPVQLVGYATSTLRFHIEYDGEQTALVVSGDESESQVNCRPASASRFSALKTKKEITL